MTFVLAVIAIIFVAATATGIFVVNMLKNNKQRYYDYARYDCKDAKYDAPCSGCGDKSNT